MEGQNKLTYRKIDLAEGQRLLDALPDAVLLDVREEAEYNAGHVRGALLLPLDEICEETARAALPDPEAPALLYCRTGRRSALAAEKLLRLGYRRVYDLGGLASRPCGPE